MQVGKHIGGLWREISAKDKKKFEAMAAKDKKAAEKANAKK